MLKNSPRIYTKMSVRRLALVSSTIMAIFVCGWFAFLNFSKQNANGASNGDYRSIMSGNWNVITTWQKYSAGAWIPAIACPISSDGVITIQNGHTVTVTAAGLTLDQVVINTGGQVTLNTGVTITVANGSGTDFDVSGIFSNAGTMTISGGASVAYQSGGKYQHNYTASAGTIPTATWNAASTCEIIGYTTNSTKPSGLSQSFGNFTWNCVSQSQDIDFGGSLTSIAGNFTVAGTGSKSIVIASSGSTLALPGNYIQTGGICTLSSNSSSPATLNLAGNYNQSGGTFTVATGSNSTCTVNVSGNWSHTGGTLTVGGNSSTNAQIKFAKSGSQTFTASSNTVSGNVDFTVNSGSILTMGSSILSGRNFTFSAGAELQIGSATGITSSGATGNIQVTGSRSFNGNSTYTFNGSTAQSTGNGLPSSVSNLTLNNGNGLTLTATTAVSNILTLTAGKITTGTNELQITNSSTTAISGYSTSNYVVGNLRLTVSGSGTYPYPVGSPSYSELLQLTLNSTSGFSTVLGKFTNADPINSSYPLTGVMVSESPIDSMLNYGYWTLTPNSAMTSGSYSVKASEKGYSNSASSMYYYPLLIRANSTSSWQTNGNDQAFKYLSGTMTSNKTGISSFGDLAIGFGLCPPIFSFDNYTLISGTANTVGAVYLVSDIGMALDAWVQITDFTGGASVSDVDNWDGTNGYEDAWQPFINIASNTTSSVGWRVTFKVGGTSTDTIIPNITFAAIDVDGDGSSLREYVTAYKPSSISYNATSLLQMTNVGPDRTATAGSVTVFPSIDTINTQVMFKVNYKNVNTFQYRTGAITTGGSQVRQASLYFKSFYSLPITVLPIKLISFDAKRNTNNEVNLKWITATETNNDYFTIERSSDGRNFEKILTQHGAGNSNQPITYNATDRYPLSGTSYYRLKQTDYDGKFTYSDVRVVNGSTDIETASLEIKSVAPTLFNEKFKVNFTSKEEGTVDFMLTSVSGRIVATDKIKMNQGWNTYEFNEGSNLLTGMYFVVLMYKDKKAIYKAVKE